MAKHNVYTFTAANWQEEVAKADQPVLVDFWAAWCGPCRMLAPVVDDLAQDYGSRVKVGKLNVDEYPQIASEHGVQSIPTLLLFHRGQALKRMVGVRPKTELKQQLEQVL